MLRCEWADSDPLLADYHDKEWGVPLFDDVKHFESLSLEVMQCGLSWMTVLKKREVLNSAFLGFDPEKVASFKDEDVERIMSTDGMIRSRRKILAVIRNARAFLSIKAEYGSFSSYIWGFSDGKIMEYPGHADGSVTVAKNELSERVSSDLKSRGFCFLGPVTVYSYLQAVGIINDHYDYCFRYRQRGKSIDQDL